jgi:arsenate reductase
LLELQNYPTGELSSKDWAEFSAAGAPELDFVFTLCDSAAAAV